MRKGTFKMRERGCQMRHFRAIAQDLAALATICLFLSADVDRVAKWTEKGEGGKDRSY